MLVVRWLFVVMSHKLGMKLYLYLAYKGFLLTSDPLHRPLHQRHRHQGISIRPVAIVVVSGNSNPKSSSRPPRPPGPRSQPVSTTTRHHLARLNGMFAPDIYTCNPRRTTPSPTHDLPIRNLKYRRHIHLHSLDCIPIMSLKQFRRLCL